MIWRKRKDACAATDLEAIEFQVIGELRNDPGHLLLMCRDGHWYDYDLAQGMITPIEPTHSWSVDVIDNAAGRAVLEPQRLAS